MPVKSNNPPSLYPILIAGLLILAGASLYFKSSQRPATQAAAPATLRSNLKQIGTPTAFFYSKVFSRRDRVFVSIPYQFPDREQPLWLFLSVTEGLPRITNLIYYPRLNQLDWPVLRNDSVSLYQKNPVYASVEAFINNPPPPNQVVMDAYLTLIEPYKAVQGDTIPTASTLNLDQYQYVLTTFKPPRREGDLNYFETLINASDALVSEYQELDWLIHAPEASEDNTYTLGQIHVDYR